MSASTLQKMTIVSCVVLCVALLLPKMLLTRGNRDAPQTDGPTGHFPPMPHRAAVSDEQRRSGRQFSRAHNPEAIARAKGASTGASTGGKSNLAGQIIPIYGFGILLYILYILFKITSRGKTTKSSERRFSAARSQNMKRKITDFELAQLQDRLNDTKDVIESIISTASVCSHSVGDAAAGHEEQRLLHQLKEITRIMQEGPFVDQSQSNTEDQSCGHQWDAGFAEDEENVVNQHFCCVHAPDVRSNTEMQAEYEQETQSSETLDETCVENKAEEPDGGHEDEETDANRNRQSEPETPHQTQTVSDNSTIRQRNRKAVK